MLLFASSFAALTPEIGGIGKHLEQPDFSMSLLSVPPVYVDSPITLSI
ncbi:hypothetical protein ACNKHN_07080 [Shigella flexneri]